MGMTIDEAIYCMKSYLPSDVYTHCIECKYYGCNDNNTCKSNEAHQKAIDIMQKYQKIEKIIENRGGKPSMRMTQLTQEVIERDFCPRCLHYIDKQYIYKDYDSDITITMGTVKDCKFHTDTSWLCDFKEVEDGNVD